MTTKCINLETFKLKLEELRPNCFNSDKVIYKNSDTLLILVCIRCDYEFSITPRRLFGKKKECCDECNKIIPKKIRSKHKILYYLIFRKF